MAWCCWDSACRSRFWRWWWRGRPRVFSSARGRHSGKVDVVDLAGVDGVDWKGAGVMGEACELGSWCGWGGTVVRPSNDGRKRRTYRRLGRVVDGPEHEQVVVEDGRGVREMVMVRDLVVLGEKTAARYVELGLV